jgi:hypothetical protein
MWKKLRPYRNVILVVSFIGSMLLFMFGTAIYVSSEVANCSSVKKAKNLCMTGKLFNSGNARKNKEDTKRFKYSHAP